jgi:hypothetical protein
VDYSNFFDEDASDIDDPDNSKKFDDAYLAVWRCLHVTLAMVFIQCPIYAEQGLFAAIGAHSAYNGVVNLLKRRGLLE